MERKEDVVGTEAPSSAASTNEGHACGRRKWGHHNLKQCGWSRVGHSQQEVHPPLLPDARPNPRERVREERKCAIRALAPLHLPPSIQRQGQNGWRMGKELSEVPMAPETPPVLNPVKERKKTGRKKTGRQRETKKKKRGTECEETSWRACPTSIARKVIAGGARRKSWRSC